MNPDTQINLNYLGNNHQTFDEISTLPPAQRAFLINLELNLKGYNLEILKYNNTTFFYYNYMEEQNRIIKNLEEYESTILFKTINHIRHNYNVPLSLFINLLLENIKFDILTCINPNYVLRFLINFMESNESKRKQ
jgi:hypothetical protein